MEYIFGYIVPISVFTLIILSSLDWMFKKKKNKYRPTIIGYIGFFCAIIAMFYGWYQYKSERRKDQEYNNDNRLLLQSIEREGTRLLPSDFQIKLTARAHAGAIDDCNYEPPERLYLLMIIGDISAEGYYEKIPKVTVACRGRDPYKTTYYTGSNLFVDGLNKLPYLDQLAGKTLRLNIPRRELGTPFLSNASSIQIIISIKGRELPINKINTKSDMVEIYITPEMLK